eukprot:gene7508-biopygen7275
MPKTVRWQGRSFDLCPLQTVPPLPSALGNVNMYPAVSAASFRIVSRALRASSCHCKRHRFRGVSGGSPDLRRWSDTWGIAASGIEDQPPNRIPTTLNKDLVQRRYSFSRIQRWVLFDKIW